MRRTIFLALLAALLLAPAARAADPIKILRDCNDDGVLQGDYTASELREAEKQIPTDADEYSDCRDVLSRALSGGESGGGGDPGGGDTSGGGSPTSGGSGDPTGATTPAPTATAPSQGRGPGDVPMLERPEDWQAVDQAAKTGDRAVEEGATPLAPGASRLAADVGRNGLPGSLIALLALLAAAALSSVVPFVRRRVSARRQT